MPKLSEYELQRQRNIEANRKLLQSLGLDHPENLITTRPKSPPKRKASKKTVVQKKRKTQDDEATTDEESEEERPKKKVARGDEDGDEEQKGPVRRSQRVAGKKAVDYSAIEQDRSIRSYRVSKAKVEMDSEPRNTNKRTQNPKQYGHIPGIEVGTWWETREACSTDAIHAPWVGGIAVGPKGAYSVALSGGYDDDVDFGYGFTYTGSGGRDLKGTKEKPKNLRTAPQSSDQTFENNFNRSLKLSSETKKPIRVVRGFKLPSPFAPAEGYRYDGLYTVEKAWREPGNNSKGYLVCKFAFKRLPGQPPLPMRDMDAEGQEAQETDSGADSDQDTEVDKVDRKGKANEDSEGASETEESATQVDEDAEGEDDSEA